MKVKAAIEKEYWLLMLSQPRSAPKAAEPPLARLSHFMYTGNGAGLEGDPADGPGVVVEPRSHSESTGLGECHGVCQDQCCKRRSTAVCARVL